MKSWQSVALRIVVFVVGFFSTLLPRSLELRLGPLLGRGLMRIGKRRRLVAFENMRNCFPDWNPAQHESMLRANFEHYGILLLELLHLASPFRGHYRRYVLAHTKVEGLENWKRAHDKGKGVLFVASHLGNWELMAGAGALAGVPTTMVTKHLKPEWLHRQVETARLSVEVRATYEPRTLPTIMKALKRGESVGFVMDQYAGPPMGIPVPFFGVKVGTLAAVSVLVERTGAAVIMAKTYRDRDGIVRVCMEPEIDFSHVTHDNERCTALLTQRVEAWVREHPEQWYWIHRRFKNVVWPHDLA